jgi:diguanylate cyclase (GGDEF)-like protein
MQKTTPRPARWQFGALMMAPILVCLFLAAGAVVGFVVWASHQLDRVSIERQTALMASALEGVREALPRDQQAIIQSPRAVRATAIGFDADWVHEYLGLRMYRYFDNDAVMVFDADNRPVYAMRAGDVVNIDAAGALAQDLSPLIDRARRQMVNGGLLRGIVDYAVIEGSPSIVGVMPIYSSADGQLILPAKAFLHASIIDLDATLAQRVSVAGILAAPRFSRLRSGEPDRSVYPLIDANGRFIAFAEWDVYLPGRIILNTTAPALAGALLVAGLLFFLLMDQLWRHSAALERGRLEAQHQAAHDPLTGLFNRSYFDEALGRALAVSPRRDRRLVGLLMLDLDRFKHVNDTLGHQAGDDLIRAVGQRLAHMVGADTILARLGGDEFGIIHLAVDERDAQMLCQAIIEAIGKPFDVSGSEVFVGVSIGLVLAGPSDRDRRELARKADIALYEAKSSGRNRVALFQPAMNELLQNRHRIEAELREALRRTDQLSVAYQPLIDAASGRVAGAEALVRWRHPVLGQVSPAHFVPVAEGTGLIEALGEFVLRNACTLGGRWPGRTIAVNISPTQLRNPKFPERVFAMLAETGMQASDLELEITEGILLEDEQVTSETLRTFRAAGIRIALDDFGTGYSSLNYLKRYAVNRIKIDRSFVSQLAPGAVSTAIVQAMITLAHALGIETTAEGVETPEQMAILAGMGCNTFQGYLLSEPLAGDAIETVLNEDGRHTSPARRVAIGQA